MSVGKGFDSGFGCVLGVVAATVMLIAAVWMAGKYVEPCPSCFGSGKCTLCGGTGKGIVWGDCLKCGGRKKCQECGGVGWKRK